MNKLRVWHSTNLFHTEIPVSSIDDAKKIIDMLAESDLNNPNIDYNAFGLEEHDENFPENGGWSEWYNDNGEDIVEVMDSEG